MLCTLHREGPKRQAPDTSQARSQDRGDKCGDQRHHEDLDIAVLDRDRFVKELAHMSKVQGAFVLASVRKDDLHVGMTSKSLGRLDTSKERSEVTTRRGGDAVCMSSSDAEEKRCAQCATWFQPRPCPKHPGKMTKYCEDCKPSQPAGGGSNPTNAVRSKGAQADDNSQLIFKVNVANLRGRALLDTGASIDFVDRRFVEKMRPAPKRTKQNAQITLGDNSMISSTESCDLTLVINNRSLQGTFQILDLPDNFNIILGVRFIRQHDGRPILSQRTCSFSPNETGRPFVTAGLTIMTGGLPHVSQLKRQDIAGAISAATRDPYATVVRNRLQVLSTT